MKVSLAYKQPVDVRCLECLAGAWGAAGVWTGQPPGCKNKTSPSAQAASELPGVLAQCEWGVGWAVQGVSPCPATRGMQSWPLIATVSHVWLSCVCSVSVDGQDGRVWANSPLGCPPLRGRHHHSRARAQASPRLPDSAVSGRFGLRRARNSYCTIIHSIELDWSSLIEAKFVHLLGAQLCLYYG